MDLLENCTGKVNEVMNFIKRKSTVDIEHLDMALGVA